MPMVDPNEKKWNEGGKIQPVDSGTHDFVGLGFEHFAINGKKCIEVRSICIQSAGDNEGKELRDLFFIHNDKALSRFVSFAKDGCGWKEPFDPEDREHVARIIGNRPFRATVKATQDGQYVKHDCGWSYAAPRIETDPATGQYVLSKHQLDLIAQGRKAWDGYVKWRAANPRDAKGGDARPTGGGGSGGGGGSSGGGYDDIPF